MPLHWVKQARLISFVIRCPGLATASTHRPVVPPSWPSTGPPTGSPIRRCVRLGIATCDFPQELPRADGLAPWARHITPSQQNNIATMPPLQISDVVRICTLSVPRNSTVFPPSMTVLNGHVAIKPRVVYALIKGPAALAHPPWGTLRTSSIMFWNTVVQVGRPARSCPLLAYIPWTWLRTSRKATFFALTGGLSLRSLQNGADVVPDRPSLSRSVCLRVRSGRRGGGVLCIGRGDVNTRFSTAEAFLTKCVFAAHLAAPALAISALRSQLSTSSHPLLHEMCERESMAWRGGRKQHTSSLALAQAHIFS